MAILFKLLGLSKMKSGDAQSFEVRQKGVKANWGWVSAEEIGSSDYHVLDCLGFRTAVIFKGSRRLDYEHTLQNSLC